MITEMTAVQSLRPNARCAVSGTKIILWEDSRTEPTELEIKAERERLEALEVTNEPIKNQILQIESTITLTRLLEGGIWLEDRKSEIANLKSQLV